METVEVAGLRIRYQRAGQGPPLVLLHGAYEDSRIWRRQLEDLSADFTVFAWDAPGCGGSDDPPPDFTGQDLGDALAGFLRKRFPAGRTSSGCPWAPALRWSSTGHTRQCPRRCCWSRRTPAGRDPCRPRKWSAATRRCSPNSSSRRNSSSPCGCPRCSRHTLIRRRAGNQRHHGRLPPGRHAGTAERQRPGRLPRRAAHHRGPTLLLYGTDDVRSPQSVAREMNRRIPGSTLVMIPDVGHMAAVEAPAPSTRRYAGSCTASPRGDAR